MAYRSTDREADVAEILSVYRAEGFAAADRRCREIAGDRGLAAHELLGLADAVRRAVITN